MSEPINMMVGNKIFGLNNALTGGSDRGECVLREKEGMMMHIVPRVAKSIHGLEDVLIKMGE
jgi:hypothetical protein